MRRRTVRQALGIVGAVVGAGFATGREINAFFARFGAFSWIAAACAVGVVGVLLTGGAPKAGALGKAWRWAYPALSAATGGAMLAAAGEIAALILPVRGAAWIGMAAALGLAAACGGRPMGLLAWCSGGMSALLVILLICGAAVPGTGRAVASSQPTLFQAACSGACYGGFNAALAIPVTIGLERKADRAKTVAQACVLLACLLAAANTALLRHPELRGEAVPLLGLASGLGRAGQLASAACLLLAVLSTLLACCAGLAEQLPHGRVLSPALIALTALAGFGRLIDRVYPLLGGVCFALLACLRLIGTGRDHCIS